jgi:hypothetical protein
MPIAISLALLGGAGILLFVVRRRNRRGDDGSIGSPAPEPAPAEPPRAWPTPATAAYHSDDGPDATPDEEVNIPRWRRPSVQAARFSQSRPRQTVYQRFAAESPGLVQAPIKGLTPLPPKPAKPLRRSPSPGPPTQGGAPQRSPG